MKFFGRNRGAPDRNSDSKAAITSAASASHRITLGLARAENLASMLARSRASEAIEVPDMLAGLYLSDWERLSPYWREADQDQIEDFLRKICDISPQRWHSWIELYDSERKAEDKQNGWNPFRKRQEPPLEAGTPLRLSTALAEIFKNAGEIAPYSDIVEGRKVPILTVECVLLCIARTYGSEISRNLAATGLDISRLERDAFFPKRGPLV